MSRFAGFSEKSLKKNNKLKYGQNIGSDAIALDFLKKLDSTDLSMWVLERLGF